MTLPAGLWGVPTSTVDWCEANYQYTPLVAELWNTLSSLSMVAAGALGVWLHRRVLSRRFVAAFLLLALVGLGSVAFHATLRFELQLLDELPMLYLVALMVYILMEDRPTTRFGPLFPAGLIAYAALLTWLCAGSRGRLQFWVFQVSFGSLELFSLVRVYLVHRRTTDGALRRLFKWGLLCYGLGVSLWFIDIRFCEVVSVLLPRHGIPNPQLHAFWHLLVSCGFYALLLVIGADRLRTLGRTPSLRFVGGLIPRLEAT